ncbi:MAG: hypothetical protein M1147_11310 [Nitrospirae bacterium]|nr:hypothetical protein [Nitrospirota bacterium]
MNTLKKIFADSCKEAEEYGPKTVLCNSWDELDEAIKNIGCGLVSPGGTGLGRDVIQRMEREGLIRVFRIRVDDPMRKNVPLMFRCLYPPKVMYILIPWDDVKSIKGSLKQEVSYG